MPSASYNNNNNKNAAIIGLAVGCSILALALVGAGFAAWRRRQRKNQPLVPYGGYQRPTQRPNSHTYDAGPNYSYGYENGYGNGNNNNNPNDYTSRQVAPSRVTSTYDDTEAAMSQVDSEVPTSPPRIALSGPSPASVYTLPPHPLSLNRPTELATDEKPAKRSSHVEGTRWA